MERIKTKADGIHPAVGLSALLMAGYTTATMSPTPAPIPSRPALRTLLLACALTLGLWFVPIASFALYPLRLFVTFIHEGSHALAAILTGGTVAQIVIRPDASGYTLTAGGSDILIAMAGYLGAAAYGAGMLALARRPGTARPILAVSGVLMGLIALMDIRNLLGLQNLFGLGWGIIIAAGLLLAARRLSARAAELTVMFLGVQCVVNALYDLKTLVGLSTNYGGPVSDAVRMSQLIPLPPLVWSVVWCLLALAILGAALRPYWHNAIKK